MRVRTPRDRRRKSTMPSRVVVLVKHALPILDSATPARDWPLDAAGETQARQLADQLRAFLPFRLVSSGEPKAMQTSAIVAAALSVTVHPVEGLREFDRPALPIMPPGEHARVNAEIFARPDRAVLGRESAYCALARFDSALRAEVSATSAGNLVAITHGTVISLFVAEYNALDPFTIWKGLECASFVVLELPSFGLLRLPTGATVARKHGG
jgi:broad specificity phosphatase PhoE